MMFFLGHQPTRACKPQVNRRATHGQTKDGMQSLKHWQFFTDYIVHLSNISGHQRNKQYDAVHKTYGLHQENKIN